MTGIGVFWWYVLRFLSVSANTFAHPRALFHLVTMMCIRAGGEERMAQAAFGLARFEGNGKTSSPRVRWNWKVEIVEIWGLGGWRGFWCRHCGLSLVFSWTAQRSTREITGKVRNLVG